MPLTGKEMFKLLKAHGWTDKRQEGSYHQLFKDGKRITVPVHENEDLKKKIDHKILREAGLK